MRRAICFLFLLLLSGSLLGQAVRYDEGRKIWLLSMGASSYAMGVDANNHLRHIYWGSHLWRTEDLTPPRPLRDGSSFDPKEMFENEEYAGWGGPRFYDAALKLVRADGNRDLVLQYASHSVSGNELHIRLKDIRDDINVTLHYRVYPSEGVLRRHSTIENNTRAPITVESAQSATWHLPAGEGYKLRYLTGRWAAETQLVEEPVHVGTKVLESRKGHTSHGINPWFSLDDGAAGEESGRVWFGALAWSGNWRITVEQTQYQQVRVTGGYNSFDFAYSLAPGETLETPAFFAGFTAGGYGAASRTLHRFERSQIFPGGLNARPRPVLYNSWEATTFNVDEPGQKALADKAASLGVELFVMDDGWFGERNHDRAGLGDWTVNPKKFPQGLKGLIDHVNAKGMEFGLWVEPEMVNADSDLYRAHPDWVIHFPDRPRSELRNQMVLNMARDDVREHIFKVLDKLATENNVRYFKWDMNRAVSEPGWPGEPLPEQRELWVKYVRNVYEIIDRLRAKHPTLEIESCSGGGGRVDLGILARSDVVWPSDNTEAFDRLRIQEGFTQAYAPQVMSAWVTDVPNMNRRSVPLKFRFLVAMQGALGIGANLNEWKEEDFTLARQMISLYKRIRPTVQQGALYRLMSPRHGEITANQYVAEDGKQAVLFVTRHAQQYNLPTPAIRLRGLDEKAVYKMEMLDGPPAMGRQQPQAPVSREVSGAYLMSQGLNVFLRGDYDSTAVMLERVR
ncbi:MAG: alpha-galactosidase [Bryobacterales bacterium]|nr:alpha-galactosidase [Bryobacterales bacterium]